MIKKILFTGICSLMCFISGKSQVITDSLANDFRTFAAKNLSKYRTLNLFWETKWAHDYTFSLDGKDVEKMRKKNLNTIKFSTMIPILKLKNASLYGNFQYSCYKFDAYDKHNENPSAVFSSDNYDYFSGGLNGSYYMTFLTSLLFSPLL